MTFEEFTQSTLAVLEEDGIEAYQPMLAIPALRRIASIPEMPDGADPREAIQDIIARNEIFRHEFMFGVRSADNEVIIGHFRPGRKTRLDVIRAASGDFQIAEETNRDWWTLDDDAPEAHPRPTDP